MLLRKDSIVFVLIIFLMATAIIVVAKEYFTTTTLEQEDQWMVSGHNFDPATSSHAVTGASCVECHNSEWFVRIQVNYEEPPAEDLTEHAMYGHTCTTCHEAENPTNILTLRLSGDVVLPSTGEAVSAGISATCMSCHNGRRENPEEYVQTSTRGPHHGPQADMLSGVGAVSFGEIFGSSAHTIVTTKGCLSCHLDGAPAMGERGHNQVGGHTFKMHWDGGTPNNPTDDVYNLASCQACHPGLNTFDIPAKGDYDGDGEIEGVQTEVMGLLELVEAALPHDEEGNIDIPSGDTPEEILIRGANYNYLYALEDRSLGIHNTAYTVQMLRTTYEKLTGETLAGKSITAVPLPSNRPTTSAAITEKYEQWEESGHNYDPAEEEEYFHGAMLSRSCLECHNSEWFVRLKVKVPPDDRPAENLTEEEMPEHGMVCSTCHAIDDATNILRLNLVGAVTLPSYGDVVDAGVSAACMSCHNARYAKPDERVLTTYRGAHGGPQADMLAGKSAISYGAKLESTSHFTAVEKKCVGCHMSDTPAKGKPGHNTMGDHTFSMVSENGTPDDSSDDIENVAVCQSCHAGIKTFDFPARADYDGDGKIEGVQTEVKGLLAVLADVLPKDDQGNVSIPTDLTLTTPEQRMAFYNYTFVANDGSYGIHNLKYAVSVLRNTYKEFTGMDLGPDKTADNVFFLDLAQGLNMISMPLMPMKPITARIFAEELSAAVVIKYDEALGKFVGFTPTVPGSGFAIEGGKGYIVNVSNAGTYAFTGSAWNNEPSVAAAPPATKADGTWAFVVSGSLLNSDNRLVNNGSFTVTVKNLTTGITSVETLDTNGYFTAAWADLNRKAVIAAGDKVEIAVMNSVGSIVSGPFTYEITPNELGSTLLKVQLRMGEIIPEKTALLQNFPNPFNPETWIPYNLKEATPVSIRIYSSTGQLIRTLDLGYRDAGIYGSRAKAAYWDGKNEAGEEVSSGIYFYSIKAGNFSATKKMIAKK